MWGQSDHLQLKCKSKKKQKAKQANYFLEKKKPSQQIQVLTPITRRTLTELRQSKKKKKNTSKNKAGAVLQKHLKSESYPIW